MIDERTILSQAAEWFAVLRDEHVSESDRQRWRAWLSAHPDHARAWRQVEAIGRPFEHLHRGVVAPRTAHEVLGQAHDASRRRTLKLLGFGGLLLGTGLLFRHHAPWREWAYTFSAYRAMYRTAVGEVRTLTLDDGSQLAINTASAVDIRFGDRLRLIVLRDGELLVTTAQDEHTPPRPLVVDTAHGRLTALGTRFSVRGNAQESSISVFEGTVRITPASGSNGMDVTAGWQACFDAVSIEAGNRANPAREGWSRGLLIADDMRLDDFIADLAGYTPIRFQVADDVAGLRLIGVYSIAHPARDVPRVLMALRNVLPIRIERPGPGILRIDAR